MLNRLFSLIPTTFRFSMEDGAMGDPEGIPEDGQAEIEMDPAEAAAEAEIADSYGRGDRDDVSEDSEAQDTQDTDEGDENEADEEDEAEDAKPAKRKAKAPAPASEEAEVELDGEKVSLKQLADERRNYKRLQRQFTQARMRLSELEKGGQPTAQPQPAAPMEIQLPDGLDESFAPVVKAIAQITQQGVEQKLQPILKLIQEREQEEQQALVDEELSRWDDHVEATAKRFKVDPDKLYREHHRRRAFDPDSLEELARELGKAKPVFTPRERKKPAATTQPRPQLRPRQFNRLDDPGFVQRVQQALK